MSGTVHLIEALVVGAIAGAIVLVFALRKNPRVAAWLGITLAATK